MLRVSTNDYSKVKNRSHFAAASSIGLVSGISVANTTDKNCGINDVSNPIWTLPINSASPEEIKKMRQRKKN